MNTKALIVSLILGSSSVALAEPSIQLSAPAHGRLGATTQVKLATTIVRDHRDDDRRDDDRRVEVRRHDDAPPAAPAITTTYRRDGWHGQGGWNGEGQLPPVYRPVMLANALAFGNEGRAFITVGSQAGRFGTLQISAAGGQTFVKQVYVQFASGKEKVIRDLDRTLVGRDGLTVDLGCREAISRIVVYGGAVPSGWRRPNSAFTVTAS